ncbi:hypothetical protein [Pseudomonas sp. zfem002]|uniref:hypothetical protein n=1 Tax=Pseudomonas sp. zfem002 TaxID=3078197 RepID=UPI002927CD73|nr:hypothetical protein [Pseudomonas sp. zfem002]MDU9393235.1 hypothetical protein [Pseudomonas sp. zfem002]
MESIDPSDAMKNFVHTMSFKKGVGFSGVSALDAQRFAVEVSTLIQGEAILAMML